MAQPADNPSPFSPHDPAPLGEVRMRGFASRTPVEQALAWLDAQLAPLPHEKLPLQEAAGRVLAQSVTSSVDVPGFDRSMMDGFAVRGADTLGASTYNRLPLKVVGEVLPAQCFDGAVAVGQAVRIMTGAALPADCDAVVAVEKVQIEPPYVLVHEAVPPGKHVGRRGEDISAGTEVLAAGRRLRPQDIGALASIGAAEVAVVRRPRVRILVTGDELLPCGSRPTGYRVTDSNGPMLSALVERDGGLVVPWGIVPDRVDAIRDALTVQSRRDDIDIVLVSGGSSVGHEDHAPGLVARHGELAIHGIAMRPSSPTGMGRLDGRLVFLLPGNPVSCLCAYDFFAGRAIRGLGARPPQWPYRRITAPLAYKLNSMVGRVDYARVRVRGGCVEPLAVAGASDLSSACRADGFVVIPADSEGYPPGAEVEVHLYDLDAVP